MTSVSGGWTVENRPSSELPPLAWVMRVAGTRAIVDCGSSVRLAEAGFFEGSWAGPADIAATSRAAQAMGSGAVIDNGRLVVVTPSHTLDGIFYQGDGEALVVANTLVGLLTATATELREDVPYPHLFGQINQGVERALIELPSSGAPIRQLYWHNLAIAADGAAVPVAKPIDAGFGDFADYRDRTIAALRSIFNNAPGYQPVVALSSGYDSAAAAVLGAAAGLRRAASLRQGVAWRGYSGTRDVGDAVAGVLGLELAEFDRLAYVELDDLPEAEFLANGMSGEDVVWRSMEPALRRSVVLSGFWGSAAWRAYDRSNLSRTDLSGASLVEFRLRNDFIHVPVPYIGGIHQPDLARIRRSPEMQPFSVGGIYDEPVPRRLAEEAGVARDAFATTKLATSRRFHIEGRAGLTPRSRADFEAFAGSAALAALPSRPPLGRRHRLAIRLAHALHVPRLAAGIERRKREGVHLEPVLGSLLLRWAVARLRARYGSLRRD